MDGFAIEGFAVAVAEGSWLAAFVAAAASACISLACLRFACQIDPANPTTKAEPAAMRSVEVRIGGSDFFLVSTDIALIIGS
jgi:hypothetical protein